MNFGTMLFSPAGRSQQKEFWIGCLCLLPLWFAGEFLHTVFWFVAIYPMICVTSKRLHDSGRSGWLIAIPYAVTILATLAVLGFGAWVVSQAANSGGDIQAAAAAAGDSTLATYPTMAAQIFSLAFLVWIGLQRGDPGPNAYGPPPEGAAPAA